MTLALCDLSRMRPLGLILVGSLVVLTSCSGGNGDATRGVKAGNHLHHRGPAFLDTGPIRVGDSFSSSLARVINDSDTSLEIVSIEPVGSGIGDVVGLDTVGLVDLTGFAGGCCFKTYPPMHVTSEAGCPAVESPSEVAGFELLPGQSKSVVASVTPIEVGNFEISGITVRYRIGDQMFEQSLEEGLIGEVRKDGNPIKMSRAAVRCARQLGLETL